MKAMAHCFITSEHYASTTMIKLGRQRIDAAAMAGRHGDDFADDENGLFRISNFDELVIPLRFRKMDASPANFTRMRVSAYSL